MKRIGRLALPASIAALVAVVALGTAATADPGTILKFDTMAPVTGPYVGAANPIRGVPGGGLPLDDRRWPRIAGPRWSRRRPRQ